jgi:hypothetical protein
MSSFWKLNDKVRVTKEMGYSGTDNYEELWAEAQVGTTRDRECLKTLLGFCSYLEKSGVSSLICSPNRFFSRRASGV